MSTLLKYRSPRAEARAMPAHARRLSAQALRHFRHFRWLAEVSVSDCDETTSARLAEEVVTRALDGIHLLFGGQYTSRMQVGGLNVRDERTARMTLAEGGNLEPSISMAYLGEVRFDDSWVSGLNDKFGTEFVATYGIALEAVITPNLLRPLSQRYLDAAQWFGEATRDKHNATKVVKLMTALERMLLPIKVNNIADVISDRIAAVCLCPDRSVDPTSFDEWRARAKRAYDLRSKLVHGSISPNDLSVANSVFDVAELAHLVLVRMPFVTGPEPLKAKRVKDKEIHTWFDRFVAQQKVRDGDVATGHAEKDL